MGNKGYAMHVRVLVLVAALIATITVAQPSGAQDSGPVLGGQLYSTGTEVTVEVLPASAALKSTLFLLEPEEVRIATNRDVGTVVTVGPYESGLELLFGIRVSGQEYRMGPADRNPDGIVHARVEFLDDGCAIVGFEDLFGGGDRDYDDNRFRFCGGIASEPPEPEPEPEPEPFGPPSADAGPDQSVLEGDVVTLDGTQSADDNAVDLEPARTEANLPGGTSIAAALDGLLAPDGGGLAVAGVAEIGQGVQAPSTALVYVPDVSGSTLSGGGCGGDANGDGRSNNILDCEIAAARALNRQAIASGTVAEAAAIVFASSATTGDLSPADGVQVLVAPDADEDGSGVPDVEEALASLVSRGFGGSVGFRTFSDRRVSNTSTNFSSGLQAACGLLQSSTQPNPLVVFLSDGANNSGTNVANVLPCDPPATVHSFAAGPGVRCASTPRRGGLQTIANLTSGTCTDVTDLSTLPDLLSGVIQARLLRAELTIGDSDPIDVTDHFDPTLPLVGPAEAAAALPLPDLEVGTEVCLTVVGEDAGGQGEATTCSTYRDPDAPLQYQWDLVESDGPAVFLTSPTSASPSFVAPDDGRYVFELTVTNAAGRSDTDRVTVTVDNVDPGLTIEPGAAYAGGVTLVNASFTDDGWLDTHAATVNWGDGTIDDVDVTAQGSGWGTFFGSHVYDQAGSFAVTVTLTDDDGGSDVASVAELTVAEPVALWANSTTAKKGLDVGGGSATVEGRTHSNGELVVRGDTKTFGPLEYVTKVEVGGQHELSEPPTQVSVEPMPVTFDLADFAPGGPVATAVGDAYVDHTDECGGNATWNVENTILAPGVHYVDCNVQFDGDVLGGAVTLVATGSIRVDGTRPVFEPYWDGLLFLSASTSSQAIDVETDDSKYLGVIYTETGGITLASSGNRFFCGVLGDTVAITGSDLTLRGANCGRPDSTVSGPLLVPDLALDLAADRSDVAPSETVDYQLTATNEGALLVVPGLMGLENVDTVPATVTGSEFLIETFSVADGTWVPLADAADGSLELSLGPNPFPGVSYPADGNPVGTTVSPDGWATWGYQGLVTLDPAQVDALLDPAVTGGIRTRVEFTLDPAGVQARRLFTFGTDFIDVVRGLSGDVDASEITLLLPEGGATTFDAATTPQLAGLAPGQAVTLPVSFEVPAVPPRTASETDAGYLSRLLAVDGASLTAAAFALAQGGVGRLVAPLTTTTTTEHVPVVSPSTLGPTEVPAGTTADYDVRLANLGSVEAGDLDVAVTADSDPLTVSGSPSSLLAGQLATATTTYTAPDDTDGGPLPVRSEATWSDAVGNTYGPTGSTLAAQLLAPATLAATLADELHDDPGGDGGVSPGDTVRYTLTVANTGDVALEDVVVSVAPDANAPLVVGSVVTSGAVDSGNASGDDTVLVSIPTVPGSSTSVITFDALVADPFPDGVTRVTVLGSVTADGFDPVLTDDPALPGAGDATHTRVVVPRPALVAFLTGILSIDADGSGGVSAGDTISYQLVVNSVGTQDVTGIHAEVPTPDGATLSAASVTTSVGTVLAGPDVAVDVGTLAPFEEAQIGFDVVVDDPLPDSVTSITTQAFVTSTELGRIVSDDPTTFDVGDGSVLPIGGGGGSNPERPAPIIDELSLAEGTVLTEPTPLITTLAPPEGETLDGWTASYRLVGDANGTEFASGTGADVTAVVDPTTMPNGSYVVTIRATSSGGGVAIAETTIVVDGQLKLGRFVTTYVDLDIGVAGLPVQVRRTYDSFDRTAGDFGVGWSLDIADFTVATNGPLGGGGWVMEGCGSGLIFVPLCFHSTSPHYVTVTWPDGRTEIFDLTPAQGSTFFPGLTSAEFTGRPNTTSTLEALDTSLFFSNGNLLGGFFGSNGIYDPKRFRLTDQYGTEYLLEVGTGLTEMRDLAGNVVTIDDDGVTSSFGPSVAFVRDGAGRIIGVDGPGDADLSYSYDSAGDLASVADPNGDTTTYTYDDHRLVAVDGPDGNRLSTLVYDGARLVGITDGDGNTTELDVDVSGRTETVTSPDGRLVTISTFDERGNRIRLDEIFDGQTATTTFEYDDSDNLTSRRDPAGNEWHATWQDGVITSFEDPEADGLSIVYDDRSLPQTWTDQQGNVTEYVWNADGTLAQIVDAEGHAETYTYDGSGNRLTRTDRAGNTWTWTYTSSGLVETETDPRGHTTTYTYDDAGRVLTTTDPLGGVTARTYDAVGNLLTETDPNGHTTTWEYDDLNRVIRRIDPEGFEETWTYTPGGLVATAVNGANETTTYSYGPNRQPTAIQVAGLAPTAYEYDGAGRLVLERDPVGRETTYAYNPAGRLESVTNPAGGTTTYTYTGDGQVATTTDPTGSTTTTSYTPRGMVEAVTDALGNTTSHDHDAIGRPTTTTRADGTQVTNTYDAAGRLVSTTDPAGTTSYGYDAAGNRTVVTDPTGVTTTSVYDELNRLASVTDGLGNSTAYTYDDAGRLVETTSGAGVIETYGYDDRGLRTSRTNELGHTWATTFDGAGRPLVETNPRGATTSHAYDPAGRLASIADHAGNAVSFGYDDVGQRTSLTDPRGKTWSYTYAPTGGIATETDPLGNVQTWEYDLAGRQTAYVDARGVRQDHTLDDLGRRTATGHVDGQVTYDHDALGRRTEMVDETGITTWTYDDAGRVTQVAAPAGTVGYGYDDAGRRTSMTAPDGLVTYGYDAAGRLDSVTDWDGRTVTMGYDGDGRRTSLAHPNGVTTTWDYDVAGRPTGVAHTGPSGPIESYTYTLDAAGNRTSMTSSAGVENYTVNLLDQLTGVSYPGGPDVTYGYDAAGNRLTETVDGATTTYSYDDASRLTSAGGTAYTYDAAGNVVTAGTDTYRWDWDGRLVDATVDGQGHAYSYDADGLRTEVGGEGMLYDRFGDSPAPTLLSDGSTTWLHDGGTNLSAIEAAGASYLAADALGSVRAEVGANGAVTGTAGYDVFGQRQAGADDLGPFGFTGGQHDPTGSVYLTARHYQPEVGRFLSVDPVRPGAPGVAGYNPYTYVGNNPATWTDPTGAMAIEYATVLRPADAVLVAGAATVAGLALQQALLRLLECLESGVCVPTLPAPTWPGSGSGTGSGTGTGAGTAAGAATAGELARRYMDRVAGLTEDAAIAAATACLGTAIADFFADVDSPCTGGDVRLYFSGALDQPVQTGHIKQAQRSNPTWLVLNRREPPHSRSWLSRQPVCIQARTDGKACDEYPFASAHQGGRLNNPSLLAAPIAESTLQGTSLSSFYRRSACQPFGDGTPFAVIPVTAPIVPTFSICK